MPATRIVEAAHLLGKARAAVILSARGPEQQSHGVDNVLAFINLALALGQPGKPSSGFGRSRARATARAGASTGRRPTSSRVPQESNPAHREHVARVWGIDAAELPGAGGVRLRDAGRHRPRGAACARSSSWARTSSCPRRRRARWTRGWPGSTCSSWRNPFLSETARMADVVSPSCQWAEEEGTMTNLEGRLLYRRAAKDPPEGVRTDLQILKMLAAALGRGVADRRLARSGLRRAPARRAAEASPTTRG